MENRHMRLKTAAVKLVGAIFILLLLVLIPILYFTIKMAVKHAIEEILVSKEKFKENTDK